VGKAIKHHFTFYTGRDAAEKGTLIKFYIWNILFRHWGFGGALKINCGLLIFPLSAVAPYKLGVTPTELYDHDLV